MKLIKCFLMGFVCLVFQSTFAKTEINLHETKIINLSRVEDNELSVLVPFPGINPGWGNCGIAITAFDAAPEFQQLFEALEISSENLGGSLKFTVDTQEPQGAIEIDFSNESGKFWTSVLMKTKNGSAFSELSQIIFGMKAVMIYPVKCEQTKKQENL